MSIDVTRSDPKGALHDHPAPTRRVDSPSAVARGATRACPWQNGRYRLAALSAGLPGGGSMQAHKSSRRLPGGIGCAVRKLSRRRHRPTRNPNNDVATVTVSSWSARTPTSKELPTNRGRPQSKRFECMRLGIGPGLREHEWAPRCTRGARQMTLKGPGRLTWLPTTADRVDLPPATFTSGPALGKLVRLQLRVPHSW